MSTPGFELFMRQKGQQVRSGGPKFFRHRATLVRQINARNEYGEWDPETEQTKTVDCVAQPQEESRESAVDGDRLMTSYQFYMHSDDAALLRENGSDVSGPDVIRYPADTAPGVRHQDAQEYVVTSKEAWPTYMTTITATRRESAPKQTVAFPSADDKRWERPYGQEYEDGWHTTPIS